MLRAVPRTWPRARTLLLRLERAGHMALPARRGPSVNARRNLHMAPVPAPEEPIRCAWHGLQGLRIVQKRLHTLWACLGFDDIWTYCHLSICFRFINTCSGMVFVLLRLSWGASFVIGAAWSRLSLTGIGIVVIF